jgi:hypothetical protein
MRVFYHHLQRGASRAEALRRAKLRFLTSGGRLSHPHYWAAFVLTGEGLEAVSTAVRWRTIVIVAIMAGLAVIAVRVRPRSGATCGTTADGASGEI